ncbi:two-component system regulatory protein YycI [Sporosarcina sp. HYO08]|uniref:two-component system regulatory protein YycI n=1 Tax=Sporosarcina sp. HYO08 TaxID=1759557 RepID=UPI00079A1597|nr:two-component system regulatory protein YycI [Sporosarcina sp. HYO08]KXH80603.1 hypothetical protein AU377_07600 [Sporosarcina sp. HYO08]
MDWNKTKTIFIVIFSILNVFLYSLYLNQRTEAQNVQVAGKLSIEESLGMDNITYDTLPSYKNESAYVSGKKVVFKQEDVNRLPHQVVTIIDDTKLTSEMKEPLSIRNGKGTYQFTEFLTNYVWHGTEYVLWEVDEEARKATFFQHVNGEPLYFSPNAMLVAHWDEENLLTHYEQRMFKDFVSFNRKKVLLSPLEAIGSLASRGYLKQDSKVTNVELGYSTLVQLLTETQVFAPTWHVRVKSKDGELEDYFINAIEGKVTEFQVELLEDASG